MALQKQLIDINLAQGIETQVDAKVLSTKNLVVENATFNKFQALQKCKGYEEIPHEIEGGGSLSGNVKNIFKVGKTLMAISGERKFYSFYSPANNWRELVGAKFPAKLKGFDLNYRGSTQNNPDMAFSPRLNLSAHVYEETESSSSNVVLSLYDHTKNNVITTILDDQSELPRVHILDDGATVKVLVIYKRYTFINYEAFDIQLTSLASGPARLVPLGSRLTSTQEGNKVVYFCQEHDNKLGAGFFDFSLTLFNTDFTPTNACDPDYGLAVKVYGGNIYFSWISTAQKVIAFGLSGALGTIILYEKVVSSTALGTIIKTDFIHKGDSIQFFSEIEFTSGLGVPQRYIRMIELTYDDYELVTLVGSWNAYNFFFKSEIMRLDGKNYALLGFHSDLQKTNYFCELELINYEGANRIRPHVLAKTTKGLGSGFDSNYVPPKLSYHSGVFYMPAEKTRKYSNGDDSLFDSSAIEVIQVDVDDFEIQASEYGKGALLASGIVLDTDGVEVLESGFVLNPETLAVSTTSGGSLSAGTRGYKLVFEYYNSKGDLTRSAPSKSISVTNGASEKNQVMFLIPPFGEKMYNKAKIVLYRTKAAGTVYYRTKEFEKWRDKNPYSTAIQIVDDVVDGDIDSNEILYTSGGEIENDAAPQAGSLAVGNGRAVLSDLKESAEIAYSKTYRFGLSASFSDFYRISVDTAKFGDSGAVNACSFLDDKIIIFKGTSIYYIVGDGPNNNGINDNFSPPQSLSSDIGCEEKQSILNLPGGVLFKSAKGFYFLDRSLNIQYVGNSVHGFDEVKVTSSLLIEGANEARFFLASGHTLVFHYLLKEWDVFTYHADAALGVGGETYFIQSGVVYKNGESFKFNGSFYPMRVKTPWLKLNTMQGFQRIWRAVVSGEYKSPHTLNLRIYTDYNESSYESHTISVDSPGPYSLMAHIGKQKCSAIMFEIFDNPTSGGESMELNTLTLEVGVKKGTAKLGSSKRF